MMGFNCNHKWGRWTKDYIDMSPRRRCEKCNYEQMLWLMVFVRAAAIFLLALFFLLFYRWSVGAGEIDVRSDWQKAQEKAIKDCEWDGTPIIEKDAEGVPVLKDCKDV